MSQHKCAFLLIVKRECLLSYRHIVESCYPLCFFVLVVTLFPLATRVDEQLLKQIGPGVIWVAALLANIMMLSSLFSEDYRDGTLEQLVVSQQPLALLVLAKIVAQWLLLFIPLALIAPLLAMMFHFSMHAIYILELTLLLGTPTLTLWGSIIAALTTGLRQGTLLMLFILLPLYSPVLIFASQAVILANQGLPISGPLAILGALLTLALSLAPWVSAFALRIAVAY